MTEGKTRLPKNAWKCLKRS